MAKREFKKLSWLVTYYDCNADKIKYYDIFKYREDFVKKLKKKCANKEEFAEKMRREMMYYYWSRAEMETIIELDDGRIWISPWCGCREPENVRVDVTDRTDFDWKGFAEKHIGSQIYKNKAKIDIWDQLEWRWDEFIDYVWSYRHKYQRTKKTEVIDATDKPTEENDDVIDCDGRCLNCDYYDTSECPDRR